MLNNDNFSLGNAFCQQGLYDKSLQFYLKAIEEAKLVNTLSYFHYENLAYSYYKIADNTNASEYAKKALELNPHAIISNHILGNYIENDGNKEVNYPSDHPVSIVQNAMPESVHNELAKSFESENKLAHEEDSFVLYRVVGNDLYPRHSLGQSRQNVEFILANEPELPNCRKIWIVNRIVNAEERIKVIQLLEKYQQEFLEIPFIEEEYKNIDVDYSTFPEGFFESKSFLKKGPAIKERILTTVYRNKNKYAMHNNGARNFALKHGREVVKAKWVLPWDGNCFVTLEAWNEIVRDIREKQYLSHFVVPMARITSNDLLLLRGFRPDPREEPQLVFRRDTKDSFNDEFCYGRRPKVEMFWFLGIPGLWDTYKDDPWDPPRRELSKEAFRFGVAGWTSRLFSGMGKQEAQNQDGARSRFAARQVAIVTMLDYLDYKFDAISTLKDALIVVKEKMGIRRHKPKVISQEVLREDYKGRLTFIANRTDGLGERLRAILNAIYFANKLEQNFKIVWPLRDKTKNVFNVIEDAVEIFSSDFIEENIVESNEIIGDSFIDLSKEGPFSLSDLVDLIENNSVNLVTQQSVPERYIIESLGSRGDFAQIFSMIGFSSKLQSVMSYADSLDIDRSAAAIHIRGGDIIYGEYRSSQRYQQKLIPLLIALKLAKKFISQGLKPLVFVQDKQLSPLFKSIEDVKLAHEYAKPDWDELELAFFEIYIMSKCSNIVAGTSGFAAVAGKIGNIDCTKVDNHLSKQEQIEALRSGILSFELEPLQQAFAYLMLVLLQEEELTYEEIEDFLCKAQELDKANGLYALKRVFNMLKNSEFELAEKTLYEAIEIDSSLNFENFSIVRALNGRLASQFVMEKYFPHLLDNNLTKYPCLYIFQSYLKKLTGKEYDKSFLAQEVTINLNIHDKKLSSACQVLGVESMS